MTHRAEITADAERATTARRSRAIFVGWMGALAPSMAIYIVIAATGNFDPLIGSAVNLMIIGAAVSLIFATNVVIGIAPAVLLQRRFAKRHQMRFDAAIGLCGALTSGFLWAMGLIAPQPILRAIIMTIIASFAITFTVLALLLRKRILVYPTNTECLHCGYPIGTSPVCTECGKPVKQKAETQKAEIG